MRTTLHLPEDLLNEARSALGFRSKTDTVVFALREVVRRSRADELKRLVGRIEFEFDPRSLRERPDAIVIVVDTSVWVAANRDPSGAEAKGLGRLIDADDACLALPVRLELLAGVSGRQRPAFKRGLTGLPVVVPTEATWSLMDAWVEKAADAGHRFAVTDLLIAALAHEVGGLVWSLDGDFDRMGDLGFVGLYR